MINHADFSMTTALASMTRLHRRFSLTSYVHQAAVTAKTIMSAAVSAESERDN